MALIVQKYGGTSVGNPERIRNVAQRVARFQAQGHQVVVVVSAMSGETNRLIALAKEVQANPDPRELDTVMSTGEQVTIGLLAMALKDIGCQARSYTGGQVKVLTDATFTWRAFWRSTRPTCAATLMPATSSSSPDSRASMRTATSLPWGVAVPTPRPSPWLLR
jgi:aspartokinase